MYETHGLDTQNSVFFYEQDFYPFSNFSAFNIQWKGLKFDTSEHVYHWEKFQVGREVGYDRHQKAKWIAEYVRETNSAHMAYKIAQMHKDSRRYDWDDVKVSIMLDILRAKASQHEYVRHKLHVLGDRMPVENSWRDDFWGWGADGRGQNMLGQLWKQVRQELLDGILHIERIR